MKIQKNVSLQPYNSFGLEATARYFVSLDSVATIQELLETKSYAAVPRIILGGGSNILLTKNIDGIVLKNDLKGIDVVEELADHWLVKAGAGENWHAFVLHALNKGWAGVENLSLIPGSVGAGPMQNIGAYGVELKDVFHSLEGVNLQTGEVEVFDKAACRFGYRESVFKRGLKDRYIITAVTLKLNKKPDLNTSYGAIEAELERLKIDKTSIKAISQAVINIRQRKLPDPAKIGNSGSFFKNPVVARSQFEELRSRFPDMVAYPVSETEVKLAAGWLIDRAGWKGRTFDHCGVHKKQALVLVNYGGAKGQHIYDLSEKILISVQEKFGVLLEREVNVL